jgi:hypothetical protein
MLLLLYNFGTYGVDARAELRMQGWQIGAPSKQLLTMVGDRPPPIQMNYTGMNWSTLLGKFVLWTAGYSGTSATTVYTLTPPLAGQEFSGQWVWESHRITSGDGSPLHLQGYANGAFRALVEVPRYRCFIHCGSYTNKKPQAIRLPGI